MALSLSFFLVSILWVSAAVAVTQTYDFNITWVSANPDGLYTRPVIGINDQWPIPLIKATVGDRLIIHVHNQLGNQSTSLHFHGLFQNGTTEMDGPTGVSQCPIPPGSSFTYNFTIDQPGTYWYHSHVMGQYPDGLRGPLIVEDPNSPYKGKYDQEVILSLSDWYHDQMPDVLKAYMSYTNPTGAEPVPKSALMNDQQNATIAVQPGKTYLFHIVNMGAFAGQYFWIEGHTMHIVEVDGVWTNEAEANMLYFSAAQRYSVLVTMRNDTSANFPIVSSMDKTMFDKVPAGLNENVTSYLVYDSTKSLPPVQTIDEFNPFDDFNLVPTDGQTLLENVDHSISLKVNMGVLGDGVNYAFFNGITYVPQKVPTLYTALSAPADVVTNASIYGANSHALVLNYGDTVELIVNNDDEGKHPFHLHAHNFQVVARGDEDAGFYDPTTTTTTTTNITLPQVPMRRDTILVHPNSHAVLRFRADNPGVWLFHCHIEFHIDSGLVVTMVEAPLELQAQKRGQGQEGILGLPPDHIAACKAGGNLYEGNAGGNTAEWFDLRNANYPPNPLPEGFTAGGIVALVFSILAAFLGLAVISWYGAAEIKQPPPPTTTTTTTATPTGANGSKPPVDR